MKTRSVSTLLAVLVASAAQAGVLAPRKASEVKTIGAGRGSAACADHGFAGRTSRELDQLMRTGFFEAFTIPPGQVFVVTAFSWQVYGAPAGELVPVNLLLESDIGFNAPSASTGAVADSTGDAAASELLGAGIVVRPGDNLCVSIQSPIFDFTANAQGFFASDR